MNVHAPKKDKTYDVKGSFQKELEQVFHKLSKHYMKIWFGGFNDKATTSGNESIHKISNDDATSENITVRSIIFPHHNIQKTESHCSYSDK
jgi:hypothetical protein